LEHQNGIHLKRILSTTNHGKSIYGGEITLILNPFVLSAFEFSWRDLA
jgi:hypothetical protein